MDQDNAFKKAKEMLSDSNLSVHYDENKSLVLACDASPYGLGAVLSHVMNDGFDRPIAFASRTLTKAERNYSQIEKKGLAIVYAFKKFYQYVYGRQFTILTDYKPLLGILSEDRGIPPVTAARTQRWAILLSVYNYSLQYRPANKNGNADFMSRFPSTDPNNDESRMSNYVYLTELIHSPVTAKEIEKYSKRDSIIVKVIQYVQNDWPSKVEEQFKPYVRRKYELSLENSCLLWKNQVVIPHQLRDKILHELHDNHPEICRMKSFAPSYVWWPRQNYRKLGQKF